MKEYFFKERGLYYRKNSFEPNQPTLVFVHGLSGSSSAWLPYEKILEKKYNLLTYDMRGHGKSKKPTKYKDYALDNFTEELNALLNYEEAQNCVLVSHSFGTLVVLKFIAKYPNRAKASVFLSPNFAIMRRKIAKATKPLLSLVNLFRPFPFSPKIRGHVDYSLYPNTKDWSFSRMSADVSKTGLRVFLYCTKQSCNFDMEHSLEKISMPVLLIHGKEDTIFPVDNSILMSQKIKGSELILIPNADHIISLNNVSEITKAVESFVGKNQARILQS